MRRTWVLGLALAALTVASYWTTLRNGFIDYDDGGYVVHNEVVLKGLTGAGVGWAFTTSREGNWHPLTWLSHMLDVQLFALRAGGHHFTSLVLHTANTVLLFVLLSGMTGLVWRSAFVAAFFAVHPLHVESVAWVAERKDVLSTFFFLATLLAYRRYVEAEHPRGRNYYALALLLFALGLMSKPMLVTLPFVLLLLDWWPLGRFQVSSAPGEAAAEAGSSLATAPWRPKGAWFGLVRGKLPFFVLAVISSLVTIAVQRHAMSQGIPLGLRFQNAVISYCKYLGKLFWPANMAIFYPFPIHSRMGWAVGGAAGLLLVTLVAFKWSRRVPWAVTGWFWFLGTLAPVIGILQVGGQAMADRYTYIPSIGIFIVGVWAVAELAGRLSLPRLGLALGGAVLVTACAVSTRTQLGYWKDNFTLFSHALQVTQRNAVALHETGRSLAEQGHRAEAAERYRQAIALNPSFASALLDLAFLQEQEGDTNNAFENARGAVRAAPWGEQFHNYLANLLWKRGDQEQALSEYRTAVRCRPTFADARFNLALCLMSLSRWAEAEAELVQVVRLKPEDIDARESLAEVLLRQGRPAEAEEQLRAVLRKNPNRAEAQYALGRALVRENKLQEAMEHFRHALALKPDWPEALNSLAWLLATNPNPALRSGNEAVRLAERACALAGSNDCRFLSSLDAAYAEAGRFPQAIATAEKAREMALRQGQAELGEMAQSRLELYRKEQAYHQ